MTYEQGIYVVEATVMKMKDMILIMLTLTSDTFSTSLMFAYLVALFHRSYCSFTHKLAPAHSTAQKLTVMCQCETDAIGSLGQF